VWARCGADGEHRVKRSVLPHPGCGGPDAL
jgi:hypothetical protein